MKEPERLEEKASPVLGAMLTAARMDQPPAAAIQRTLVSLGVAATAAGMTTAAAKAAGAAGAASGGAGAAVVAKAGSVTGAAGFIKWIGAGIVGGLVAIGAIDQGTKLLSSTSTTEDQTEPAAAELREQRPQPGSSPGPPAGNADQQRTAVQDDQSRKETPSEALPTPENATGPERQKASHLAAEAAALDKAREALRSGQAGKTLQLLKAYEQDFPGGRLGLEARYLRMEAHFQRGNDAMARAVAQQLLATHPTGPHAARARLILEGTNP